MLWLSPSLCETGTQRLPNQRVLVLCCGVITVTFPVNRGFSDACMPAIGDMDVIVGPISCVRIEIKSQGSVMVLYRIGKTLLSPHSRVIR